MGWRVVVATALVLGAVVASLLLLDRVHRVAPAVDPGIARVDRDRTARLLILHVDSWRYETAMDSTLMPRVARLRREGSSARLLGVYEGFTIPAVRAAFTGRAETQLVNLIQNFHHEALPLPSFFRDVAGIGKRTLVVGNEAYTQFGPYFTHRRPPADGRDQYARDREGPELVLRGYREEGFDVVVGMWESLDWRAHEDGIGTFRYREEARRADSVIAAFAAARAPQDYLLVYGDHGHTTTGEHKTGYDIPSSLLFIGPDVARGVALSSLAMTNLRLLASHAMGITLREGAYDTEAIAAMLPGREPARPIPAEGLVTAGSASGPSRSPGDYGVGIALLALLAVVSWWSQQRMPGPGHSLAGHTVVAVVALAMVWWRTRAADLEALLRPAGMTAVVLLYAAGVIAKCLLFRGLALRAIRSDGPGDPGQGRRLTAAAALSAGLLALVAFQVLAHPVVVAILLVVATGWWWRATSPAMAQLATLALLQLLLIFTLRLPLHAYAWIDGFLLAVWWTVPSSAGLRRTLHDLGTVLGAFLLTCSLLPGRLEWGFLYDLFPASQVEESVAWFLPFILLKLPLLVVVAWQAAGRTPDRRTVQLLWWLLGAHVAVAWSWRLAGGPMVEIWPLAEDAAYLTTFTIAALLWGWQARAGRPADTPVPVPARVRQ